MLWKNLATQYWRYAITILTKEFDESEIARFTEILIFVGRGFQAYQCYGTRQGYSQSLTLLTTQTFWKTATVLSEYQGRGDCKARFSCILRDRWKKLRTVMVSQNTLKTLAPCRHYTQTASIKSVNLWWLVGVARGPIRRNRSNRHKTGPGPIQWRVQKVLRGVSSHIDRNRWCEKARPERASPG